MDGDIGTSLYWIFLMIRVPKDTHKTKTIMETMNLHNKVPDYKINI